MTQQWEERRREERSSIDDEITIFVRLPKMLEIQGKLIDTSGNGFRVLHMYPALSAGQKVSYEVNDKQGAALVVWNRIYEEHVETGFFVFNQPERVK